ncbi:MAG: hypothetical protein KGO50_03620 [Myxococcales bacterium]|nr:hypothetical protein [Myxococcales bacterium]
MRNLIVMTALTAAAALTACGGSQKGLEDRSWSTVFELVPADAAWGIAFDVQEAQRDVLLQSWSQSLALLETSMPGQLEVLGIDPNNPASLESLGVDLTGEYAAFSPSLSPLLVLKLSDVVAWNATVARIESANIDLDFSDIEVGPLALRRATMGDASLDYGVYEGFAIARFNSPDPQANVSDEEWLTLLQGPRQSMLAAGPGLSLAERVPAGQTLSAVGFMQSIVLSDLIWSARTWRNRTASMDAMGLDPELAGYSSAEQRDRCMGGVERFTTTLPWMGMVASIDDTNPLHGVTSFVLQFGTAGAERVQAAFPGTITQVPQTDIDNTTLFFAGRTQISALRELLQADPSLAGCPDIAGALATARVMLDSQDRQIDAFERFYSGGLVFALNSLSLGLLSIDLSALAMVTSNNPAQLADRAQDMARGSGFSTSLVNESPLTRIDMESPFATISMLMMQDRVMFHTGELQQSFINTVATAPDAVAGAPFMIGYLNGERLNAMIDELIGYSEAMGLLPAEQVAQFQQALVGLRSIGILRGSGFFSGSQMVIEADATMVTPSAGSAE